MRALERDSESKIVFSQTFPVCCHCSDQMERRLKKPCMELQHLFQCYEEFALQLIPGHNGIQGNEIAHKLAKEEAA